MPAAQVYVETSIPSFYLLPHDPDGSGSHRTAGMDQTLVGCGARALCSGDKRTLSLMSFDEATSGISAE